MVGILAVVAIFGREAGAAVFGFVVTYLGCRLSAEAHGWKSLAITGVLGVFLAVTGFAFAGEMVPSALLLAGVSFMATVVATRGTGTAIPSMLMSVWAIIALSIGVGESAFEAGAGYFAGFLVAAMAIWWPSRGAPGRPGGSGSPDPQPPPQIWFALLKAVTVAIAVVIGFEAFGDFPYWVALTVIIVAEADIAATLELSLSRSVGTLLGVVVGIAVVNLVSGSTFWTVVAIGGIAWLEFYFMDANYVLFAVFLTALVVVLASLANVDSFDAGWSRLVATALGAVMAIGSTWLSSAMAPARHANPA